MIIKKIYILFGLLILISGMLFSFLMTQSIAKEKEAVLFIGNSYTYRNKGVDQHLEDFVYSTGKKSTVFSRAAQGKFHLYTHFTNAKTLLKFNQRQWDKVILQEYSSGPIADRKNFFAYGKKWAARIRKNNPNATIYLYSTWGYKKTESMTDSVYNCYKELGEKINAKVIPVGKLWEKVQKKVNLYDADNAHPNRKGTFLTACLFYEFLEQKDVRLTKHSDRKLPKWEQKKLKRLAHEFYRTWRKSNV